MKILKKLPVLALALIVCMAMTSPAFAGTISKSKAVSKALKSAGVTKSQVRALETDKEKGRYEVEFIRLKDKAEFSFEIRVRDGKIVEKEVDYNLPRAASKKTIGKNKARSKAAKHAGVKVKTVKKGTCKLDKKDREYDVKFKTAKYRYDYDIDAASGKVKEYSKKYRK